MIHDSFINCLDVTTPRGQSTFQTWAARTPPGVALVTPVHDNEGLRVGDCNLRVITALNHKTSRCVETDLVSWSLAEAKREMKDVQEGGEAMSRPSRNSGSCEGGLQASRMVHLKE